MTFGLPPELRNQVTRLEIASERSAGAVNLLDGRSQWQRVGMISGESQEQSQPLVAPLYYLEKAVQPYAEIIRPKDHNLAKGIEAVLKEKASVLMLADIGTLSGEVKDRVRAWVERGGVLVRFAGPRLESGGDDLLPVALRMGGRALGGALSWSSPQLLADFDEASLFAGIPVPKDVTINRQVLADPAQLTPAIKVWASTCRRNAAGHRLHHRRRTDRAVPCHRELGLVEPSDFRPIRRNASPRDLTRQLGADWRGGR